MAAQLQLIWQFLLSNATAVFVISLITAVILALDDSMITLPISIGGSRLGLGLAVLVFGATVKTWETLGGVQGLIDALAQDVFSITIVAGLVAFLFRRSMQN